MISVKDVKYTYDAAETQAIKGVSFDIADGEFVAIVGRNGSGKSTIAKLLNALLIPEEGTITVDGLNTVDEDKVLDIRKKVGVVFQDPDNQIVTTVVEEDVGFGPENLGIPTEQIVERVHDALDAVDMLAYAKSAPHMLSGGQKQRIAVAGMLAIKPKVLVLDEATAMLDPLGRKKIIDIIMKLHHEQGITVIMITQYMEEAVAADRIIVMNGGLIECIGTPKEIFAQDDRLRSIGLDVPVVVGIRDELVKRNIIAPCDVLTAEELAEVLCPLLLKN